MYESIIHQIILKVIILIYYTPTDYAWPTVLKINSVPVAIKLKQASAIYPYDCLCSAISMV